MTVGETLIATSIEYCDRVELLEWVRSSGALDKVAGDPDVAMSRSTNHERKDQMDLVVPTFERIATEQFAETILSDAAAEHFARHLFECRLQEYLEKKCTPWQVCRMISPIESQFDFPDWLGDMYNTCDWVEPCTSRADCRWLYDGVSKHLQRMR